MIELSIQKELNKSDNIINMDINLEIKKGEFVIVSGDSGSGKTTLLRCIAGLEDCNGTITVNNNIWQNNNKKLKIQKRDIGFVFQNDALFTNMSVEENLLYVNNDKKLALRLLDITDMSEFINSMPSNLSGGQKQRVSICRALMKRPSVLLLDEPFSALHDSIKTKLYKELLQIHNEFNITTIMVSHDMNEVYTLATRHLELQNANIVKDINIDDLINNTKVTSVKIEAKILKLISNNDNKMAIVNINNKFITIILNDKMTYQIGDIVKLNTKDLILF